MRTIINKEKVYHYGDGAPDNGFLFIGEIPDYVFIAGDVFSLKTGKTQRIQSAYKIESTTKHAFYLRKVKCPNKLKELSDCILNSQGIEEVSSLDTGWKIPRASRPNEEMTPAQKAAYRIFEEGY